MKLTVALSLKSFKYHFFFHDIPIDIIISPNVQSQIYRDSKRGFGPKESKRDFGLKGQNWCFQSNVINAQSSAHSDSCPNPIYSMYSKYLASNFIKNWFNLKSILDYA